MIIWDLDNTMWDGILSESEVKLNEKAYLIAKKACDCGIVSSICSNNNYLKAMEELTKLGIGELFVFPAIGYGNKGKYISEIITKAHLRAENVLFIDDSDINLEEAIFYEERLNTLRTDNLVRLEKYLSTCAQNDVEHSKLRQYKILEGRCNAQTNGNGSTSFLYDMDFRVEIREVKKEHYHRILELNAKSHQINYTRKVINGYEIDELNKSATLRWVGLHEKLGDDGIVGFFCLKDGKLIHFVFSCRVINIGLPQWIYTYLGCPDIDAAEDVAEPIEKKQKLEDYIRIYDRDNEKNRSRSLSIAEKDRKLIYFYGSCNMHRCMQYLSLPDNRIYFDSNQFVDGVRAANNSSEYLCSCFTFSDEQKQFCCEHFSNYRNGFAFNLALDKRRYDYAIFSFSDDSFMHVYESKSDPFFRISGRGMNGAPRIFIKCNDVNDPELWFRNEFVDTGLITEESFERNLRVIRKHIPIETVMILVGETQLKERRRGETRLSEEITESKMINSVMKSFCEDSSNNSFFVDINDIITSADDFTDYIFHWTCDSSYKVASALFDAMLNKPCKLKNRVLGFHDGKKPVFIAKGSVAELMKKSIACNAIEAEYYDITDKSYKQIKNYLETESKNSFFLDVTNEAILDKISQGISGIEWFSYGNSGCDSRIILILGCLNDYLTEKNINTYNNYLIISRPLYLDGNVKHLKYGLLGTEADYIAFDLFYFLINTIDSMELLDELLYYITTKYSANRVYLLGITCKSNDVISERIMNLENYVLDKLKCRYVSDVLSITTERKTLKSSLIDADDAFSRLCEQIKETVHKGEFTV